MTIVTSLWIFNPASEQGQLVRRCDQRLMVEIMLQTIRLQLEVTRLLPVFVSRGDEQDGAQGEGDAGGLDARYSFAQDDGGQQDGDGGVEGREDGGDIQATGVRSEDEEDVARDIQ